jgi:hypothetical protein
MGLIRGLELVMDYLRLFLLHVALDADREVLADFKEVAARFVREGECVLRNPAGLLLTGLLTRRADPFQGSRMLVHELKKKYGGHR